MGQAIAASLETHEDLLLAGVWVRDPHNVSDLGLPGSVVISDDIGNVAAAADVIVDFSLPDATGHVLAAATNRANRWFAVSVA